MNPELKELIDRLIDTKALICGRIINNNGVIEFERVEKSKLESIPVEQRAYATASMGRSIFTIDQDGIIHNFKGVDSHLKASEMGLKSLFDDTIEYIPQIEGLECKYKISAILFKNVPSEIRINGTSPLEDIEIESDINKELGDMGVAVPKITYIKEIPQSYCRKYGLPIKDVEKSISELETDYTEEDDARKSRLINKYGNYQDLADKKPEKLSEYLQRIGFLSDEGVQSLLKSNNIEVEKFIEAVDSSYQRGQRYGQAERIIGSPFRISDLESCLETSNTEQIQAIMDFSEMTIPNFPKCIGEIYGRNLAYLMKNCWECENLMHRQDFSLSGEFCDDAYFNVIARHEELREGLKDDPGKMNAEIKGIWRKFYGQVMHIASCIKVVQDAMLMINKDRTEIDGVLDSFIDSFSNTIINIADEQVLYYITNELENTDNWVNKLAAYEVGNGLEINEAIKTSHEKNEEYYSMVAELIVEKIKSYGRTR